MATKTGIGPNQYQCERCKGIFDKAWSEEEARAEQKENFGLIPDTEMSIICDYCYEAMGFTE